jgi:hypothetical protein
LSSSTLSASRQLGTLAAALIFFEAAPETYILLAFKPSSTGAGFLEASFGHISVLVVVLNAIGLGTLMMGIAAFLRKPPKRKLKFSGVLVAWSVLHLYVHIMLWWRFYGMHLVESFNFFHYLFLLAGPMCLLFGSTMILPDEEDGTIDMPAYLDRVRQPLFAFETGFWLWALLAGPLIEGTWGTEWYLWAIMVGVSIAMAVSTTRGPRVALTATAWLVQLVFIVTEALVLREGAAG